MQSRQVLTGIALSLLAVACFSVLDTTVQYLSAFVPILMALWLRYAFQTVATAAWLAPKRGLRMLRTQRPGLHMLRGLLLVCGTAFAFSSLKVMPVGEFTAVVMITSLVARTEDPLTMHLSTGLVGVVLASVALPFVWVWLPGWQLWALLALMGAASTAGHLLLIKAFQKAPPATIMPCQYAQIAFALLGGWLVFRYVPDGWSLLGMGLIALCGGAGAWLTVREGRSQQHVETSSTSAQLV